MFWQKKDLDLQHILTMAISCVSHGTSATIDTAGVSMLLLQTINHECIFFSGCESLVLQSINQWGCCAPLLTSNGDDLQMIREKIEMMSIRGKVWEMWRREIPRSYDDGDTGTGWIRNIYQDREHIKYKRFFWDDNDKKVYTNGNQDINEWNNIDTGSRGTYQKHL